MSETTGKKRERPEDLQNEPVSKSLKVSEDISPSASTHGSVPENSEHSAPVQHVQPKSDSEAATKAGQWTLKRRLKKHAKLFNSQRRVSGVLLFCRQAREALAMTQMLELIPKYAQKFVEQNKTSNPELCAYYPPHFVRSSDTSDGDENADEESKKPKAETDSNIPADGIESDGEESAAEESKKPQDTESNKPNVSEVGSKIPLDVYNCACSGLLFIGLQNLHPVHFAQFFLQQLKQDASITNPKNLACLRVVPMEIICKGSMSEITAAVKSLVDIHFNDSNPVTYAVVLKSRNAPLISKMDLINEVAKLVPPVHKVDLKSPTFSIVIEVFKSAAGVSVIRDYNKVWRKFNLQEYCCK